jgi:hypothetical protein
MRASLDLANRHLPGWHGARIRHAQIASDSIALHVSHDEFVALPLGPDKKLHGLTNGAILPFDLSVVEVQNQVVLASANVGLGELNPDICDFGRVGSR